METPNRTDCASLVVQAGQLRQECRPAVGKPLGLGSTHLERRERCERIVCQRSAGEVGDGTFECRLILAHPGDTILEIGLALYELVQVLQDRKHRANLLRHEPVAAFRKPALGKKRIPLLLPGGHFGFSKIKCRASAFKNHRAALCRLAGRVAGGG